MKAYISANGELTVKSETDIEHYALDKWWEGWCKHESSFHVEITKEGFTRFKSVGNEDLQPENSADKESRCNFCEDTKEIATLNGPKPCPHCR